MASRRTWDALTTTEAWRGTAVAVVAGVSEPLTLSTECRARGHGTEAREELADAIRELLVLRPTPSARRAKGRDQGRRRLQAVRAGLDSGPSRGCATPPPRRREGRSGGSEAASRFRPV